MQYTVRKLTRTIYRWVAVLAVVATAGTANISAGRADEADAKRLLKAMSDYLAAQKAISFDFDVNLELVSTQQQKIALVSSGTMTLDRPDKLHMTRTGGFANAEMVFDGKTLTLLGKNTNLYAQVEAPGTIDQLVDVLRDKYHRPVPAADLLMSDPYKELMPEVNDVTREPIPASELILALQCGGSDGYSGISANPALGAAVDLLVRHGGSAVLSETPEIYGAEHLLTRRAASRAVGEKLIERIHWWEDYTAKTGGEMNNNPSPGNKAGGLTTILEKSLGAVAKGGSTNLVDVYRYAEPITAKGFVFMDTPGYDPVSATGQVAGGANVICFTTGRGSVFGCKPAPSLKLATNTPLFRRMEDDMDINCGPIADGEASVQEIGQQIFELVVATASGRKTKSEELGFGEDEFTPWQFGAVM